MDQATLRKMVREEIREQLNIILSGSTVTNDEQSEDIGEMFPGMPTITGRPLMHPYGFVSRAPAGTIQVTARQGEHFGNRLVLGHRAPDRPKDLAVGETAQYSSKGYQIRVLNGQVQVGKSGVYQTVVLGETLRQLLIGIIQAIVSHTHLGNLGAPTGPPLNAADFTALQTNNLDNKKILAVDGGGF